MLRRPPPTPGLTRLLLADSSVWIDHLRLADLTRARAMREGRLRMHPFVIGKIALGSVKDRAVIIAQLMAIRPAKVAYHDEAMDLIDRERLFGTGIGYVDAHLIASTRLQPGTRLWTRDKRLHAAAERLDIAARPVS